MCIDVKINLKEKYFKLKLLVDASLSSYFGFTSVFNFYDLDKMTYIENAKKKIKKKYKTPKVFPLSIKDLIKNKVKTVMKRNKNAILFSRFCHW